ncbi:hypothetical protein EXM22_07650 [Oceanispirochaeta crateris]|uniref:DUF2802 domain-containing protein n=1 Tax=Oceanispirochaeta crateris TaxID=2518645 RepID=A0A5C1QKY8_9SPIO|nr:hypothetical protein [Oceanispirochaeta crateris]QEN07869.1 hypothetical protein EXM22_07650 [Oceanispirochaeta crateris]
MTTVFAVLFFILTGGAFLYLKVRIDRVVSGEEWIHKIRDEIDQLVLEMNQTAERNVALLEHRVKALRTLLDEADKKLTVLQKESEKSDLSRQVYSHLKKQAVTPASPSVKKSVEEVELLLFENTSSDTLSSEKSKKEVNPPAKSLKDRVMDLYEQGFSSEIISQKLGASISEVDLIISLKTGQGGAG